MPKSITALLNEDGDRWLTPEEQPDLPRDCARVARPVWLYLSIVADSRRLMRRNGLGVSLHMRELRAAFGL